MPSINIMDGSAETSWVHYTTAYRWGTVSCLHVVFVRKSHLSSNIAQPWHFLQASDSMIRISNCMVPGAISTSNHWGLHLPLSQGALLCLPKSWNQVNSAATNMSFLQLSKCCLSIAGTTHSPSASRKMPLHNNTQNHLKSKENSRFDKVQI